MTGWRERAAVAVGGVLGAAVRWALLAAVRPAGGIPWPVLALNVAGSVLLGVLLVHERHHPRRRLLLHDGAGIGFCGGLTTFSTFAVEIVVLARAGAVVEAAVYGVLSVAGAVAGVTVGMVLPRRVRPVRVPLGEEL